MEGEGRQGVLPGEGPAAEPRHALGLGGNHRGRHDGIVLHPAAFRPFGCAGFPAGGRAAGRRPAGVQHHRPAADVHGLYGTVVFLDCGEYHLHRDVAFLGPGLCSRVHCEVLLLPD